MKWDNVDLQRRLVIIREARTAYGANIVQKETKNRASVRTLYLADELCLLLEHQGIAMTRDASWTASGARSSAGKTARWTSMCVLRTKLGPAGHYIETVRGVGYKIGGQA